MKDFPAAIIAYKRALAIDPQFDKAWGNLGIVLRDQKDLRLVAHVKQNKAKQIICVFHNIDMHANATRARELLGQKEK